MTGNKLATGGLVAILFALWLSALATTDNPVGEVTDQGRAVVRELRSQGPRHDRERFSDPIIRFAASVSEPSPSITPKIEASVYVPAYAQIRIGSGRGRLDLATTLSVHNSSRDSPIILRSITYHNTEGDLIEQYLGRPVALRPLGTIEIFVPDDDLRAGSGANFIVNWASVSPVPEPVIEAVMIGRIGATGYSFVSQGRTTWAPGGHP
jgi:hypothetical protein